MINLSGIVILASIFIMLLIIVFNSLQSALGFGRIHSFTLSVCVSLLSVIGIARYLRDSMETILLPYVALAIALLLLSIFSFLCRSFKGVKDRLSNRRTPSETIRNTRARSRDSEMCKREQSCRLTRKGGRNHAS